MMVRIPETMPIVDDRIMSGRCVAHVAHVAGVMVEVESTLVTILVRIIYRGRHRGDRCEERGEEPLTTLPLTNKSGEGQSSQRFRQRV